MKALQDRCVVEERVISRLRNCNVILTNEYDQQQEAKANLEKELTTLCGQVEMARDAVVTEFKASQPFIDAGGIYYGDGFEDCLKQVKSVYLDLDLSKVSMDDPLSSTLAGDDTACKETNDFIQSERDPTNDGVILAQPTVERPVTPLVPSTKDSPHDAENPSTQDAQKPHS